MSKIKLLKDVTDNIKALLESLMVLCDAISNEENETKDAKPKIELETIRAVLAEKSHLGLNEKVRALLKEYDADKLSEVNPNDYEELLKDAEAITND